MALLKLPKTSGRSSLLPVRVIVTWWVNGACTVPIISREFGPLIKIWTVYIFTKKITCWQNWYCSSFLTKDRCWLSMDIHTLHIIISLSFPLRGVAMAGDAIPQSCPRLYSVLSLRDSQTDGRYCWSHYKTLNFFVETVPVTSSQLNGIL